MSRFGVTPQKEHELLDRMDRLGIREEDLEEQFVRGGGAGGQKVNKTSSTVQLKHVPTGIDVRCQEGRSQAMNRFFARRRLCERIEEIRLGAQSPDSIRRAKISKQKKRRRRRGASGPADQEATSDGDA